MSEYTHRIRCLHTALGATTATASPGATTIAIDATAVADGMLAEGALVRFGDNLRDFYRVEAKDGGAATITISPPLAIEAPSGAAIIRPSPLVTTPSETADLISECPEDATHAVDETTAELVSSPQVVLTQLQQGSADRTHPTLKSQVIEVAAGQTGSVDFVWPYQVTVQRIEGIFEAANVGDTIDLEAGPDSTAGYLTAAVGVGDTVINVSSTVFDSAHVKAGFYAKIGTGADPNNPTVGDDLGEIVAIDKEAGTITVTTPVATALPGGLGCWVLLTIASTKGMHVPSIAGTSVSTGSEYVLGVNVPANRPLRITYDNNGAIASRAIIYMRYLI